jgi:hypothetical protein
MLGWAESYLSSSEQLGRPKGDKIRSADPSLPSQTAEKEEERRFQTHHPGAEEIPPRPRLAMAPPRRLPAASGETTTTFPSVPHFPAPRSRSAST